MALKTKLFAVVLHYFLIACATDTNNSSVAKFCSHLCPGHVTNSSVVKERCGDHAMLDRCCVNNSSPHVNSDVIGIDLSDCHIHHLNASLQLFTNIITIVLEKNPLKQIDIDEEEFYGLSAMTYLSLPSGLDCPGGNTSWEVEQHSLTQTLCERQIDQCFADNFTCPEHSYCIPRGPGLKDCLCNEGYYGYKCFRTGHFPTEWFLIGLAGATLVISAFLWITQRRHALGKKMR